MNFAVRKRWKNFAKNQTTVPLRRYTPTSLEDLRQVVTDARQEGVHVRAVGSSHSWSDAAVSPDFLVESTGLARVLPLDTSVLKDGADRLRLVEVESGITLRSLNDYLDTQGYGLPNMGGFDGQTIVGVTATSSHGSGTAFGPMTEMVKSFDVVDGSGRIVRVEPSDGLTDGEKYVAKYGDSRTLMQRDDYYDALGVSLGSIALVYSVIVEVRDAFWLNEVRHATTWEDEKANLVQGDVFKNEHYELLLNPYAINGAHTCLVTTRNAIAPPQHLPPDRLERNVFSELLASLGAGAILHVVLDLDPKGTPARIDGAIRGLVDKGYANKSYKVFNIGAANNLPALSAEYVFSRQDHRYIEAIDALLDVAADAAATGEIYQTGPLAVRFVKGTGFFLSPQFERDAAIAELIAVSGTKGCEEMLYRYEEAAYRYEGRPHWGQLNHVAGIEMVKAMYPAVDDWTRVREQLDPDRRFDSPLTRRLGL